MQLRLHFFCFAKRNGSKEKATQLIASCLRFARHNGHGRNSLRYRYIQTTAMLIHYAAQMLDAIRMGGETTRYRIVRFAFGLLSVLSRNEVSISTNQNARMFSFPL